MCNILQARVVILDMVWVGGIVIWPVISIMQAMLVSLGLWWVGVAVRLVIV